MDEIDALTKRFKDYIDKVQAVADAERQNTPGPEGSRAGKKGSAGKLYTVVSPVGSVADNLKSVLKAIDHAIDNIEEMSQASRDQTMVNPEASKDVYSSAPRQKKFTDEELDFLVKTFNKILNTSEEERKILFSQFDKIGKPPEG